jgi:outer membrane lipoprotein SlyB
MNINKSKLLLSIALAGLCTNDAIAQQVTEYRDGYVTRSETVWASRVISEPVSTTSCRETPNTGSISLGDLVVGGLVGSAIGNKLSDRHGAGTLGAVAGVLTASGNRTQRSCVRETTYTSHTEQYPSHYIIHVRADGQRLRFESDRPYRTNERVRVRVSSDFSLMH